MTVLIVLVMLMEAVTFTGVIKILALLREEPSPPEAKPRGTDFWQNIISYDHKKERRR